jgi:C-methyltransferase-like protein/putative zinc binding protein/methyltransferase family protein
MSARLVEACQVCGSRDLEPVLSLGSSPPTCVMAKVGERPASEDHHPLDLLRCHACSLVQLSVIVDPEIVFPADYPYSSGNSRALHANFEELAYHANAWAGGLDPTDLVVDIGANDGTLLSKFPECRKVGVEPTGQASRIEGLAYRAFFDADLGAAIVSEYGPAKVITACNVMAHVEELDEVMRGIDILLADDGVFVAENHDLASVVGGQWDTVYHEHLRYYDPRSFDALLRRYGFGAWEWKDIPTHGGSFRMVAQRLEKGMVAPPQREYDWKDFRARVHKSRWHLRSAVSAMRSGGKRIGGVGASARATTIINSCGFDADDIEAIYEVATSDKIGRYIPGTQIPVVDENAIRESYAPDMLVLFAWYMADSVIPALRGGEGGYNGRFLIPLPAVKYTRAVHPEFGNRR